MAPNFKKKNMLDGQYRTKSLAVSSGIKSLIVSSEINSSPVTYGIKGF
jgi:hypothetical protein